MPHKIISTLNADRLQAISFKKASFVLLYLTLPVWQWCYVTDVTIHCCPEIRQTRTKQKSYIVSTTSLHNGNDPEVRPEIYS